MRCFPQWGRLVDLIQHQRLYSSQSPGVLLLQELWTRTKHCNAFDGANFMGKSHHMYGSAAFYHGHILWLLRLAALPAQLPLSPSCSYQPNFQPSVRIKPCVTYSAPYVSQHSRDAVCAKYFAKRMVDTRNIEQWNSVWLLTQGCGNKMANCRLYLMFWWMV